MAVIEKITEINEVLKDIFGFTQRNEAVKADFDEYLATIGSKNISLNQMEKIFLPYIFERKLNDKFILELYLEESKNKEIKTDDFDGYFMLPRLTRGWNKYLLIGIIKTFFREKYDIPDYYVQRVSFTDYLND